MRQRLTRRSALSGGLGAIAAALVLPSKTEAQSSETKSVVQGATHANARNGWATGIECQRVADLGNGTYLNPVLSGDHSDPSVLRDGATYYKVSSSFDYYPGLVIWSSQDLVNWERLGPTLRKPIGSVLAPDLVKHNERYYIYFAVLNLDSSNLAGPRPYGNDLAVIENYVIHADDVKGPWSEPIALGIQSIDPGHAVGEDGQRYLFLAGEYRVRLSDDGLRKQGSLEKVYEGWPIPEGWAIENFSLESPKFLSHKGWFYLFWAEGGTAGPPTSHMALVARSRSINGPWENCPHNPIVYTSDADEPWLSRGHAKPVQGPNEDWWLVYHGYENGYRTLGRQMLLEPMVWTEDGWPRAKAGTLSHPIRKPVPKSKASKGTVKSQDFRTSRLGEGLYSFTPRGSDGTSGVGQTDGKLHVWARGKAPHEANLLVLDVGDRSYTITTQVELERDVSAGLLLFYDKHTYCGIAVSRNMVSAYKLGADASRDLRPGLKTSSKMTLKLVNTRNTVTFFLSDDGTSWKTACSFDVSGYHPNNFGGFLSLRPAICALGEGTASFTHLDYRADPSSDLLPNLNASM